MPPASNSNNKFCEELYFTSSGSTGIAPFCVQTYALTLTARS